MTIPIEPMTENQKLDYYKQPIVLSIIVPYCNLDESRLSALENVFNSIKNQDIRETDYFNEPTGRKAYEFIFIEQKNSPDYKCIDTKGIPDRHIIVEHHGAFNKSWLMNIAAKEAKNQILVFVDADMIFGKEYLFFTNKWRMDTNKPKFFVGWSWLTKMPGRDEPIARLIRPEILTAGGIFWVDRDFYWEIGGMNENYFGYGGEDNDFWIRANSKLGPSNNNNITSCPYPLVHTYHDNSVPSIDRINILDKTIQNTQIVINRLKNANLGNKNKPNEINIKDLLLKDTSIENKESRGMI